MNQKYLTQSTDLGQLALLPRLRRTEHLSAMSIPIPRAASRPRLRPSTLLPSACTVVTLLLRMLPRQIVNELVERENAEADFVVGRFAAALKQAGKGHGRR